ILPQDSKAPPHDRVLAVAYAHRPGQPAPAYDLRTAWHALSYIAMRMNQDGTRALAWWHLRSWMPATPRRLATGAAIVLVGGLAGGLAGELAFGLAFGLV